MSNSERDAFSPAEVRDSERGGPAFGLGAQGCAQWQRAGDCAPPLLGRRRPDVVADYGDRLVIEEHETWDQSVIATPSTRTGISGDGPPGGPTHGIARSWHSGSAYSASSRISERSRSARGSFQPLLASAMTWSSRSVSWRRTSKRCSTLAMISPGSIRSDARTKRWMSAQS